VQQHLDLAAGRTPCAEPGREHLRVVQDQQVARPQELRELAEDRMSGRTAAPVVDEEARAVAFGSGRRRDSNGVERIVVELEPIVVGLGAERAGRILRHGRQGVWVDGRRAGAGGLFPRSKKSRYYAAFQSEPGI
jgi:hypothetical protein